MANEITVVQYDTTQAIQAMEELDKKLENSGKKAEESFKKTEKASTKMEKALKALSPQAGSLATRFANLTGSITPMGLAVGAAAGAVVQFVRNALDIPPALQSAQAKMEELHKGFDRLLALSKTGIELNVEVKASKIDKEIERLALQRADIQEQQSILQTEKNSLEERLKNQKGFYAELNAAARDSAQARKQLEAGAASIRERSFLRSLEGEDLPRKLDKLLTRAAQKRQAGDFGGAERLVEAAFAAAEKGGDQRDLSRISAEEGRLVQAIDKAVIAHKAQESAQRQSAGAAQEQINLLQRHIALLTEEEQKLSARSKLIKAERTRKTEEGKDLREGGARAVAIEERRFELLKAADALTRRRSALEFGRDVLSGSLTQITGAGHIRRQQQQEISQARQLALASVPDFGARTVEGDQQAIEKLKQIEAIVTRLRSGQGVQQGLKFDVDNLEKFVQAGRKAAEASKSFVQQEGGEQLQLDDAAKQATTIATQLERAGLAARSVKVGDLGVPATAPNAGKQIIPVNPQTGVPGGAPASQTNNIRIDVKGGIITPEVSRAISEAVQRELRRGTAKKAE